MGYRGRFAPTPSGPLHFGSLVAALASYLDARTNAGVWLLRIEDVDPPRVVWRATERIQRTLVEHGFEWDGEVLRQHARIAAYHAALSLLTESDLVYSCGCSRKRITETARSGVDGLIYPGTCRDKPAEAGMALRFAVPNRRIEFQDAVLGHVGCDVAQECGDFVLRRADGVFTYQLAVVVDDAEQCITHVVRGADLLTSTPRQIVLQQALGLAGPAYLHVPVVLDANGEKLSKQTLAAPLNDDAPMPALRLAGRFLGLPDLPGISRPKEWLAEAGRHWCVSAIPRVRASALPR
jgi:glutamyl-Q tRNA(Asp) synthetase